MPATRSGINSTERFLAKNARHAQWHKRFLAKNARHAQWHKQHRTVSGEKRPPRAVAKNSSPRAVAELLNKEYANDGN
jgi:hypothetical protein